MYLVESASLQFTYTLQEYFPKNNQLLILMNTLYIASDFMNKFNFRFFKVINYVNILKVYFIGRCH